MDNNSMELTNYQEITGNKNAEFTPTDKSQHKTNISN